jgi:hypothetical protein
MHEKFSLIRTAKISYGKPLKVSSDESQSIQSVRLSVQSSGLGPFTPSLASECCSHPLWVQGGGDTLARGVFFILSILLILDPDRIQKSLRIRWGRKEPSMVPVWWSRPVSPDSPAAGGSAGPPLVHAP